MTRLTKRNSHGSALVNYKNLERVECLGNADVIAILVSKLAYYEDTGLTPEQINLLLEEHKNK